MNSSRLLEPHMLTCRLVWQDLPARQVARTRGSDCRRGDCSFCKFYTWWWCGGGEAYKGTSSKGHGALLDVVAQPRVMAKVLTRAPGAAPHARQGSEPIA